MSGPGGQRVLLCSDYLPPSDGGVEQVVQKLVDHLVAEDVTVGVFTLDDGGRTFDVAGRPEVELYTARGTDLTDVVGLQSTVSLPAVPAFRRVLREFEPDVVHAHNRFFFTSALAALYSVRADYRLVTTLHLGDVGRISGLGGLAASAYEETVGRFVVSRSDHVVCVSRAVEAIARSLGATRTAVVRNAVDVDTFSPTPTDGKRLLYVGRLVRNNGVQDLLAALPGVLDAHPDATVDLVGSGPLGDRTRASIRERGLSSAVTVHDYVDDIAGMYDRATVFCRPSYSEGLPLTLLEAMAAGVAPVVTDVAGVPEVVTDWETGILLQPGEPESIRRAVVELFDDDPLREELSRNARAYAVENLGWERRTTKVMDIYGLGV